MTDHSFLPKNWNESGIHRALIDRGGGGGADGKSCRVRRISFSDDFSMIEQLHQLTYSAFFFHRPSNF